MRAKKIIVSLVAVSVLSTAVAEAGLLFHATKRQVAKRIVAKGFSPAKMRVKTRFGKGVYLASSSKTALSEKPAAKAVISFKHSKSLERRALNLYNTRNLKRLAGETSLRGRVKNGVISPKLGKQFARQASKRDRIIIYRSARRPYGKNVFIPKGVYQRHPGIVKPVKVKEYGVK